MQTRSKTTAARWAFALTVLFFALGLAARALGADPYPALLMPTFGEVPLQGSTVQTVEPLFTVTYEDGHTVKLEEVEFLPRTVEMLGPVVDRAFGPKVKPEGLDPRTKRWLKSRLSQIYPDSPAKSFTVTWIKTTRSVDSPATPTHSEPAGTFALDFRNLQ